MENINKKDAKIHFDSIYVEYTGMDAYDDVQDIIEGKTEWVGKCVDAIWSDTQNQQDIRQILFPES